MWRNYLTVGFRALIRNKTYAFTNIVGLAIGLAACLLLLLYVRYERGYDSWLPNAENTYQLQSNFLSRETGERFDNQMTPYVSGPLVQRDFPQVEQAVYAGNTQPTVLRGNEALATEKVLMVNGPFFDIVRLPLVRGNPASVLRDTGTLVLSETYARRFFGDSDPVGQTLTTMQWGERIDYRVTGVMRDIPRNSHLRINMVIRIDPIAHFAEQPDFLTIWGWNSGWWYFRLRPGADVSAINAAFPAWERRNIPDQTFGETEYNAGDETDYHLTNVRDIHLGLEQQGSMAPGNDQRTLLTYTIVAFLILGMACVNFTNLATARASQRAREVALRKVLGANRRQLVTQFIAESVLVAALAMQVALVLVELLVPVLSRFLDTDMAMAYFGADGMLLPILGLTLVVGAAGGIYPAFYLSRFQPAQILKANQSTAEAAGSGRLRSALVIAQFAVSIGLIVCTAVVYAQAVHARTADPGYQRHGILQVSNIGRRQLIPLQDALIREIARLDGVVSVGRTEIGINTPNQIGTSAEIDGRAEPVNVGSYGVDENFFRTMGVRLVAGRNFDAARPMDDATLPVPSDPQAERAMVARGVNVVINDLAARRLGFSDPARAVGRSIRLAVIDPEALGLTPATIVGIVQASRFRSIREPVEPIAFRYDRTALDTMVIRYRGDGAAVRGRVEQVWKRIATDAPFDAEFSEDIVAELYNAEQARARVFAIFALLAIVIACLGLFGLAAFTAERRTKEIGIRKVLGARTRDIVRLLAWQFSKPVIVANLIAWPISWWAMRDWLNTFDARIDLGLTPFVLAGLLALAIAVGTIAGHAFRVARANPIHALRYE